MLRLLRLFAFAAAVGVSGFTASPGARAQATDGFHQLVLYISEADMSEMNGVLDIAANVSRHYSGIGEEVEIEIVAFGDGLHMLRDDTSPVKQRLDNFMQSMVNVTFQACGNTLDTMERNEGQRPALIEGVSMVQTGVAHLLQRSEEGWTLVRP
jgi:intracellular sulfur oxidation DsrE/DsrF family protein